MNHATPKSCTTTRTASETRCTSLPAPSAGVRPTRTSAERETLKDALREDPMEAPADLFVRIEHSRRPTASLGAPAAAAALLLGALAWMRLSAEAPARTPGRSAGIVDA